MRKLSQTGISLIEVIMIIVVVAVAIPPIMRLFAEVLIQGGDSRVYLRQLQYAQEKMETIIADKRSAQRGFSYIAQSNRYPQDYPEPGFVRTVAVDTVGMIYNHLSYAAISYASVTVTVSCPGKSDVRLTTWLINY